MRLLLLTLLAMLAFAANSVLNRMAVGQGLIDPTAFAALRVLSGAAVLWALVALRGGRIGAFRPLPVLALSAYLLGFALAYLDLSAGIGALILFGGVQITMFAGALVLKEPMPPHRILGAGVAFGGLVWLMLPSVGAVPGAGPAGLMLVAALGWGLYSLAGRGATDPLAETAANFVYASPFVLASLAIGAGMPTAKGAILAILSGGLTSGLGYALWYAILPQLGAARAAVAQLVAPVLALAGGLVLLAEVPSLTALAAMAVTLTGVAIATRPSRR